MSVNAEEIKGKDAHTSSSDSALGSQNDAEEGAYLLKQMLNEDKTLHQLNNEAKYLILTSKLIHFASKYTLNDFEPSENDLVAATEADEIALINA